MTTANTVPPTAPLPSDVPEYDATLETQGPILSTTRGPEGKLCLPHGRGLLTYHPAFLSSVEADALLSAVRNARSFSRTPIDFSRKLLGQSGDNVLFRQPRDTAFFGTKLYSYGGEKRLPTHWNADPPASTAIQELARRIETVAGLEEGWFDVVLVNRYNDGGDFMEWHSDNERNLGKEPVIASVSLGAERDFLLRPARDGSVGKAVDVIQYRLSHGSLLIMAGKTQRFYQHSVPRVEDGSDVGMRINLTFRRIFDESDFGIYEPEG